MIALNFVEEFKILSEALYLEASHHYKHLKSSKTLTKSKLSCIKCNSEFEHSEHSCLSCCSKVCHDHNLAKRQCNSAFGHLPLVITNVFSYLQHEIEKEIRESEIIIEKRTTSYTSFSEFNSDKERLSHDWLKVSEPRGLKVVSILDIKINN